MALITLIFQILFVIPDKFNRVLSFEVRKKKGCMLLLISLIIIFFSISMIFGLNLVNLNNIDLSFEGIARKVVIWGTAIIIVILYIRKIKEMNQK